MGEAAIPAYPAQAVEGTVVPRVDVQVPSRGLSPASRSATTSPWVPWTLRFATWATHCPARSFSPAMPSPFALTSSLTRTQKLPRTYPVLRSTFPLVLAR